MTLSSGYLEELSVRYKKQIEDLQLAVRQSGEALSLSSKAREQDRTKMNELKDQVANLSDIVGNLSTRLDTMSTWAIAVHLLFLVFEIVIGVMFILACCNGRRVQRRPELAHQMSESTTVNQGTSAMTTPNHVNNNEEEEGLVASTPTKRRHSLEEEASFVLDQSRVQEVTLSKRRRSLDRKLG